MKALSMDADSREKRILQYLLKKDVTTVKHIAEFMNLSEKTVSNSLKVIDDFLQDYKLSVVRKPKVGVFIDGDLKEIRSVINVMDYQTKMVPSTKEERITFIFIQLIKAEGYITMTDLAEELYISRGTIESDLIIVERLLRQERFILERRKGYGIRLTVTEDEKRRLTSLLIHNFWGENWHLSKDAEKARQAFEIIPEEVQSLFSEDSLKKIIKIVKAFSESKQFKFTDYAFQSIVIHLAIAVERIKQGEYIHDEAKHFLSSDDTDSIEKAHYLAKMIEDELAIIIPESEISYITIHLAAASDHLLTPNKQTDTTDTIKRLRGIIKQHFTHSSYDGQLIEGLMTHIQSAINRLTYGFSIKNPYVESIKFNFTHAFEEAVRFKAIIEKEYFVMIDDDETAYIALHFEAFYERLPSAKKGISAVLVCSTGLGSAQLLAARIRKYFPDIDIKAIYSLQEAMDKDITSDVVISTIYLEFMDMPTIVVSPMMTREDIKIMEQSLVQLKHATPAGINPFLSLLREENCYAQADFKTMEDVIQAIGTDLIAKGYATEGVIESAIQRKVLSYTSFNALATPHADPRFIQKSNIVVMTLVEPLLWGDIMVDKVFFIALQNDQTLDFERVYEAFFNLLDNEHNLQQLTAARTNDTLYQLLMKGDTYES